MSAKIMGQVYDLDLPANEQTVLVCLADHASHDGSNVYPSNGLIAWKLGMSDDTVSRMKKKLEARGILKLETAEAGRVKKYRIDLSKGKLKPPFEGGRKPGNSFPTPPQIAGRSEINPPANCGSTPPQIAVNPPAKLCGTNQGKEPSKEPSRVEITIPLILNTPEFLKAWDDWKADRKERKKPITSRAAKSQLATLEAFGEAGAIQSIRESIQNGWQGLFAPKNRAGSKPVVPIKNGEFDKKAFMQNDPFADLTPV